MLANFMIGVGIGGVGAVALAVIVAIAWAVVWMTRGSILEKLKGWRTMIFNGLVAAVPSLLYIIDKLQGIDLAAYITPGGAVIASIIIGLVGMWLRSITTGPVGSKGEEVPSPEAKAGD